MQEEPPIDPEADLPVNPGQEEPPIDPEADLPVDPGQEDSPITDPSPEQEGSPIDPQTDLPAEPGPVPGVEGWHLDPRNPNYTRFWDGEKFTSHRIWNGELASMGPPPFRPDSAPGSLPRLHEDAPPVDIMLGEVAAPGRPPVNLQRPKMLLGSLRKRLGGFRDPGQR